MLVSHAVQAIADTIGASRRAILPHQQARIELLRLMPTYAEARDLGAWEAAYKDVSSPESDTAFDLLLDAVFEFGEYNLYCAFDHTGTKQLYLRLARQLRDAGIDCPIADEFTAI